MNANHRLMAFLCGCASLILQLAISRLIFFFVANSEHSTALVITVHLSGFLIGAFIRRYIFTKTSILPPLILILLLISGVIITGFASPLQIISPIESILILLVSLTLIAIMFGFVVAALVIDNNTPQNATDIVIADALGSVVGAITSGFLLLPYFGVEMTLWTSVGIVSSILILTSFFLKRYFYATLTLMAVLITAVCLDSNNTEEFLRIGGLPLPYSTKNYSIVAHRHTPYGELSIVKLNMLKHDEKNLTLLIDNRPLCNLWGKPEDKKNTSEWLLAKLPGQALQHHSISGPAALIGLGCGNSLSSMLEHLPKESAIDVIEINPLMSEMTAHFNSWNGDVLNNPRVHLITDDGFNFFMKRSSAAPKYAAVIIDLAWMENHNVSHLFSQEFYRAVKKSMAPDGVIAIWTEERAPTPTLAVIYKTLGTVFKNITVNADAGFAIVYATDHYNLLEVGLFEGSRHEKYWTDQLAANMEVNHLDNLVLNRTKFTLFGTRDPSGINGPSIYDPVYKDKNP